ncbi:hypothetical protein Bbelb_424310 [Branchiostoma belcheri]|nr:hypothetical protein Bbelb_424310 [Branchiostoma belcheri]
MAINISAPAQRSFTEQQVLQEVAMRTADSRLHPHGFWLFLIAYTCSPAFTAAGWLREKIPKAVRFEGRFAAKFVTQRCSNVGNSADRDGLVLQLPALFGDASSV